jgi:hypothetical protein
MTDSPACNAGRETAGIWRHWLWIGLLAAASVGFSLAFACAMPFAALGALAALHMDRRDALTVTGIAWLANQLVGYGILLYPPTANSFAWGVAILVAALLAALAAEMAGRRLRSNGWPAMVAVAFAGAFAVYELALVAIATLLGDGYAAFAPMVVARILAINAAALVGLLVLHRMGVAVGVAAAIAGPRPTAAPA